MALNEPVGDEANLDTTPVAEPQAGEDVSTTQEASEGVESETPERDQKKGYQARVQELVNKNKSLEQQIAELTRPQTGYEPSQQPQINPDQPIVKPGEEIDAQEFERRVIARADARAELRVRQSEAVARINNETRDVVRMFPELDPDSDSFNRDLSDSITEATEAYIRSNPYSASVKTFVAKLMKPYQGAVSKEVGKATENIAKQVSQAALRPSSVRQPEKTAKEKSIAELEAELGIVQS